jgi:hypothetical protein
MKTLVHLLSLLLLGFVFYPILGLSRAKYQH